MCMLFESLIFKCSLVINIMDISEGIVLMWMPQDHIDDKSTLVRLWHDAIRQQAIAWANVDLDLFHHMALLGHSELTQSIVI